MWRGNLVLETEMEVNEEYEELTSTFLADLDMVQASLEDFKVGLEHARDSLNERIAQAEQDIKRKNRGK